MENKSSTNADSSFSRCFSSFNTFCQFFIPLGHLAIDVVSKDTLALDADFLCLDSIGNLGVDTERLQIRRTSHSSLIGSSIRI